eukprot:TRINITY_DN1817_c0_g2_i17.p2 TRINITY_DN1817_c0_g2~~TRINITY_DN1817_c0_g2_i17.p2  ORF type:complete len:184 (-),score=19.60 TRINITY_DN1817_c0_g2_i17:5435-5986(-)
MSAHNVANDSSHEPIPIEVDTSTHDVPFQLPSSSSSSPTLIPVSSNTISIPAPSNTNSGTTEKNSKRSSIWDHFQQLNVLKKQKDETQKECRVAECMYCKKQLNNDKRNGITHITRHFNESCTKRPRLNKNQQLLPSAFAKANDASVIHKFDQKQCRDALAKMVILHEYPFNIVTHEGFIEYS